MNVEERVPGKQGLKLENCYLVSFCPAASKSEFQENKDWNSDGQSLYWVETLRRRASSRKTRIETRRGSPSEPRETGRRASSRKTRIETKDSHPGPQTSPRRRASSRKTRIETLVTISGGVQMPESKSEFQENKDWNQPGARHRRHVVSVEERVPGKQGLKQLFKITKANVGAVEERVPGKQGLKPKRSDSPCSM